MNNFFEAVNMIVLVLCCKDLYVFCIFLLFSNLSFMVKARSNRGSRGSQVDISKKKISYFVSFVSILFQSLLVC